MKQPQILDISQNVASALNYLHLSKPNPIIHRDISSPNVLLESSVGDSFKAKVADYGAANLQQQAKTDMPGNPLSHVGQYQVPFGFLLRLAHSKCHQPIEQFVLSR